jgi:hypothetical protein
VLLALPDIPCEERDVAAQRAHSGGKRISIYLKIEKKFPYTKREFMAGAFWGKLFSALSLIRALYVLHVVLHVSALVESTREVCRSSSATSSLVNHDHSEGERHAEQHAD